MRGRLLLALGLLGAAALGLGAWWLAAERRSDVPLPAEPPQRADPAFDSAEKRALDAPAAPSADELGREVVPLERVGPAASERAPVSGPPRVLELHFVYEDGAPVASGRVALHDEAQRELEAAVIGAGGLVELPRRAGLTHLSAAGPFRPLVARPLAELLATEPVLELSHEEHARAGERVAAERTGEPEAAQRAVEPALVPVERGASVAGRVVFESPRPREPFVLHLAQRLDREVLETLVGDLQAALLAEGTAQRAHPLAADDAFRFDGLPEGWRGAIRLPEGWEAPEGALEVAAPARGHVLAVRERPCLVGRLVLPDGEIARDGFASARQVTRRSARRGSVFVQRDGTFRLQLEGDAPLRIELVLVAREPRGHLELVVTGVDPTRRTDLGDLVLERTFDVDVLVLDSAENPLAGATAEMAGVARTPSARTGADGRTRLTGVPTSCAELVVSRAGYRTASVAPPADGELLRVRLERAAALEVRLRSAPGAYLGCMRVRLGAGTNPVADALHRSRVAAHRDDPGYRAAPARRSDGRWEMAAELEADYEQVLASRDPAAPDRALFDGLAPGVELEVEVVDAVGHVVRRAGGVRLEEGERRVLELEVAAPSRVEGLVTSGGTPVGDAQVCLRGDLGRDWGWTDPDGRFSYSCIAESTVSLDVSAQGLEPRRLVDVPVPPQGELLRVELAPGRSVRVHVVDATGASLGPSPLEPVPLEVVARASGQPPVRANGSERGGELVLDGVTLDACALAVRVHGQILRAELPPAVSEATVVVPWRGGLLVRWDPALDGYGHHWLQGVDAAGETVLETPVSDLDAGSFRIAPVRAGGYELRLFGRRERGGTGEVLARRPGVVVRDGETTEIELGPP